MKKGVLFCCKKYLQKIWSLFQHTSFHNKHLCCNRIINQLPKMCWKLSQAIVTRTNLLRHHKSLRPLFLHHHYNIFFFYFEEKKKEKSCCVGLRHNTTRDEKRKWKMKNGHYKWIRFILKIAFSLIVTTRQYVGNPIDCVHTKDIPEDVLNTYCWIHSTYTLKSMFLKKVGKEVPYPGVGNSEGKTEDRKYYKVDFFLDWNLSLF